MQIIGIFTCKISAYLFIFYTLPCTILYVKTGNLRGREVAPASGLYWRLFDSGEL